MTARKSGEPAHFSVTASCHTQPLTAEKCARKMRQTPPRERSQFKYTYSLLLQHILQDTLTYSTSMTGATA